MRKTKRYLDLAELEAMKVRLENMGKREPMRDEHQHSITMYNLVKAIMALENKLY